MLNVFYKNNEEESLNIEQDSLNEWIEILILKYKIE
jgi:hypothetical protein